MRLEGGAMTKLVQPHIARDHQVPPDRTAWSGRAAMFSMSADPPMCFSMRNTGRCGTGKPASPATSAISLPRPLDRSGRRAESSLSRLTVTPTLRTASIRCSWRAAQTPSRRATDPALVECVRSLAPKARRVGSICTGTFILAAAGLLHQRRVTTHWLYSDILAKAYPSIDVDSSLIFHRDGNIYSSGGITAGIDLALALVEEDLGREIALATARTLVVFPRRPGGQSQFSAYVTLSEFGNAAGDTGTADLDAR